MPRLSREAEPDHRLECPHHGLGQFLIQAVGAARAAGATGMQQGTSEPSCPTRRSSSPTGIPRSVANDAGRQVQALMFRWIFIASPGPFG